jgi:CpeT protein
MQDSLMLTLARWMAGDFSNYQQAYDDPKTYAHIRVFFRPLPLAFFGGIGFYSEQTYDYDLWSPYRQGLHRLLDKGDSIYIENYSLADPIRYAGAGRDLNILKTITPDCLQRRHNCSMIFTQDGCLLRGSVEGKCCFIERDGHQTYLISEVELTENTFVSWDRGMDVETHQQVWGSATGPLKFTKRESFADEIIPVLQSNL